MFDFDETITQHHLYWYLNLNLDPAQAEDKEELERVPYAEWKHESKDVLLSYRAKQELGGSHALSLQSLEGASEFLEWIFGGGTRLGELKHLFTSLRDMAITLYIASKGKTREIIAGLRTVQINPELFEQIYGFDMAYEHPERWDAATGAFALGARTKVDALKPLVAARRGLQNQTKSYIDDEDEYYREAKKLGILTLGAGRELKGPFKGGMKSDQMLAIEKMFAKESSSADPIAPVAVAAAPPLASGAN